VRDGDRPDAATIAALVVAVLAVSASGSIIAFAAAPALAIAFWRNAMAVGALVPVAAVRRGDELVRLAGPARRELLVCALAGVALAAHFATWVPSTKLTTVATATALGATQPVWQGLIAVGQGRRLPVLTWVGIGVAVLGVLVAARADLAVSTTAVLGDVLALLGGFAAAVYTALGERARMSISTTSYTAVCYSACAVVLLVVCLVSGTPLSGYPTSAWIALVALTLGPQLLGHSLFTYSLRRVSATTVSVLILLEVPGSALVAWWWLAQLPPAAAWPGLALLLIGVALVVVAGRRPRGPADLLDEPIR
jgi:drug/metabolite transporter (DMT)-like permease